MRISTSNFFKTHANVLAQRRLAMVRRQTEIASGRRLQGLGTDPAATRRVLRDQSALNSLQSHRAVAQDAHQLLAYAENVSSEMVTVLHRVHELTVQMANATYTLDDRLIGQQELTGLRGRLLELVNTQHNGRFLFGGVASSGAPYASTGLLTVTGSTGPLTVPVGEGLTVEATVDAGFPIEDAAGGPNTFQTLDNLIAAFGSNNGATISALLTEVDAAEDRLGITRTRLGHNMASVDGFMAMQDRIATVTQAALSSDRDTDMIEAVTDLKQAEAGLQAAMVVVAQSQGLSLVDILR